MDFLDALTLPSPAIIISLVISLFSLAIAFLSYRTNSRAVEVAERDAQGQAYATNDSKSQKQNESFHAACLDYLSERDELLKYSLDEYDGKTLNLNHIDDFLSCVLKCITHIEDIVEYNRNVLFNPDNYDSLFVFEYIEADSYIIQFLTERYYLETPSPIFHLITELIPAIEEAVNLVKDDKAKQSLTKGLDDFDNYIMKNGNKVDASKIHSKFQTIHEAFYRKIPSSVFENLSDNYNVLLIQMRRSRLLNSAKKRCKTLVDTMSEQTEFDRFLKSVTAEDADKLYKTNDL